MVYDGFMSLNEQIEKAFNTLKELKAAKRKAKRKRKKMRKRGIRLIQDYCN
jgi:hypothetical protein